MSYKKQSRGRALFSSETFNQVLTICIELNENQENLLAENGKLPKILWKILLYVIFKYVLS